MAIPHANHQSAHGAASQNASSDRRAPTFFSRPGLPMLTDHSLAVLARTAAGWFAPSQADRLCISVTNGRIHLTGHIEDARPLAALQTALLRLPGVIGLDQMITVDAPSYPTTQIAPVRSRRFFLG